MEFFGIKKRYPYISLVTMSSGVRYIFEKLIIDQAVKGCEL